MPATLDTDLVVLHQLRLKGVATTEALAAGAGIDAVRARAALARLEATGSAVERRGRVPGFALTAAGRAEHEARVRHELDATGLRSGVERCYRAFLGHNAALVAACTAWQVRDVAANVHNDHRDASYDAAVVARLEQIHAAAVPVCDALGALLARFGIYVPRLTAALVRVRAGLHEWFAQPLIDSYHTVWMELHEDLLVTLRIERSSELAP